MCVIIIIIINFYTVDPSLMSQEDVFVISIISSVRGLLLVVLVLVSSEVEQSLLMQMLDYITCPL